MSSAGLDLLILIIGFAILVLIVMVLYGIIKWVEDDPSRKKKTTTPKITHTTTKPLLSQRDELLQLLDNFKKRLVEGTLSEDTYKELRAEYQDACMQRVEAAS